MTEKKEDVKKVDSKTFLRLLELSLSNIRGKVEDERKEK
jgi:hypothetical protein